MEKNKQELVKKMLLFVIMLVALTDLIEICPAKAETVKLYTLKLYKTSPIIKHETYIDEIDSVTQVKSIKSSNTRVASAKMKTVSSYGDDTACLEISPQKVGSCTITILTEEKEYSMKVKVLKYTNPCASLKIGNKEYAKKFKSSYYYYYKNFDGLGKKKVTVKAAKGWKIKDTLWGPPKMHFKNGKKVNFNEAGWLMLEFQNQKNKNERIWLTFSGTKGMEEY